MYLLAMFWVNWEADTFFHRYVFSPICFFADTFFRQYVFSPIRFFATIRYVDDTCCTSVRLVLTQIYQSYSVKPTCGQHILSCLPDQHASILQQYLPSVAVIILHWVSDHLLTASPTISRFCLRSALIFSPPAIQW